MLWQEIRRIQRKTVPGKEKGESGGKIAFSNRVFSA
jgi:hypothetical protein